MTLQATTKHGTHHYSQGGPTSASAERPGPGVGGTSALPAEGPQSHQGHIQCNAAKSENSRPAGVTYGPPSTPIPPVSRRVLELPGKSENPSYLKAPQGPDNSFPLFQRRKAQHLDSLLWVSKEKRKKYRNKYIKNTKINF